MIKSKMVLVVGNGLTGKAVFEKTFELGGSAEYYVEGMDISGRVFDIAVISPGISKKSKTYIHLKGSGIPIYSELDFAYLTKPFKSLCISGTNGKTTVANLVCGMLNSANVSATMLGNMGIPFCKMNYADWQVTELSSFMIEQSRFFRSTYSTITNIAPDHKEYHITFERYRRAKLKLFKLTENGVVYNQNRIDKACIPQNLKTLRYDINDNTADIFVDNGKICYKENSHNFEVMDVNEIKIIGSHNLENILNALGLCIISNGLKKEYADFIKEYKGEKYRLEYKGIINQKRVFNDSKGTNVASVISAYECMKGKTALILGGYDKKESYRPLFEKVKKGDIAFISGDNREVISSEAGKCNVLHTKCTTLEEAIIRAVNSNVENVLFSPGCSSFDRFTSFEERGKFFDEFIEKIKL